MCGGDKKHDMSYPSVLKEYGFTNVTSFDIRKDSKADRICDYLSEDLTNSTPSIIITNPPFNLAMDIIKKGLHDVDDCGFVIMLLRLNFWGSKAREQFFKENVPRYCLIHPRRMSFTDNGQTDSIEYAHFVWQKGYTFDFCKTKLL